MDVRVHRTPMTRIERIDANLLGFYTLVGSALACGVRRVLIPLANSENGTVQGAVATWWTRKSFPTRRQVATAPCTVPIRQRYPSSRLCFLETQSGEDAPHSICSAISPPQNYICTAAMRLLRR